MNKKELYELADKYQAKADKSYRAYQETGITRYDRERCNAEDMADALRMAASAADNHMKLASLRAELMMLAKRATAAGDPDKLEQLRQCLLAIARTHGLIGEV